VAIHEAGHAVVARAAGAIVTRANVIRAGRQLGETNYKSGPKEIHRRLALSLAGAVAESLDAGGDGDPSSSHAENDFSEIDADLREHYRGAHPPREQCPEFVLALAVTRRLLAENWGAVLRIAERLLSHQKVSGRLVHAIAAAHRVPE
jgi:hypothetical protein